jgi:NTP pyrophosphatase (non-canonical NTP hydrolase)
MTLNEYQKEAMATAIYPKDRGLDYCINGLTSEAGEVAGKYAKIIRDKNGVLTSDDIDGISKELGDVLWMLANLAHELELSLDEIAIENIKKLKSRQERGVLGGSGDNR